MLKQDKQDGNREKFSFFITWDRVIEGTLVIKAFLLD